MFPRRVEAQADNVYDEGQDDDDEVDHVQVMPARKEYSDSGEKESCLVVTLPKQRLNSLLTGRRGKALYTDGPTRTPSYNGGGKNDTWVGFI